MPKKKAASPFKPARAELPGGVPVAGLLTEVRDLILTAREGIARTVNAGLTLLYWEIGHRLRRDVLLEKRAEYGKQIVNAVSSQLEVRKRIWGKKPAAYDAVGRGISRDPNCLCIA